jgi:hypothetical protein
MERLRIEIAWCEDLLKTSAPSPVGSG